MHEETAAERGRRVAEARKRLVKLKSDGPFVAPLSPRADPYIPFPSAISNWTVVSLRSEIETLQCINEAKEREIQLLKNQMARSVKNALIGENDEGRFVPCKRSSFLVESFSKASPSTLNRVLGHIERTLEVREIDQVEKAMNKLASFETKYEELVRACCVLFRTTPKDSSHNQLVRMLLSGRTPDPDAIDKVEVKRKAGVAWTFH